MGERGFGRDQSREDSVFEVEDRLVLEDGEVFRVAQILVGGVRNPLAAQIQDLFCLLVDHLGQKVERFLVGHVGKIPAREVVTGPYEDLSLLISKMMTDRREHRGRHSVPNFPRHVALVRVFLDLCGVWGAQLAALLVWNGFSAEFRIPHAFFEQAMASSVVLILSGGWFGLYRPGRTFLDVVENRSLLRAILVAASGTRLLLFLMKIPVDAVFFAFLWISITVCLYFVHRSFRGFCEALRVRGYAEVSALIYGAGKTGRKLASQLRRAPEMGIQVVGFLDDREALAGAILDGIPVLGDFLALDGLLAQRRAKRLYIALPQVPRRTVLDILEVCRTRNVPFHFVPSLPEQLLPMVELREVEGIPLMGPPPMPMGFWTRLRRRGVALAFGLPAWVLYRAALLWVWIAKDPGSVVFHSRRVVSQGGRVVVMRRFRGEFGSSLMARWTAATFRILRLDSLPLSLSLIRGDLAMVGPRPLSLRQAAILPPEQRFRFLQPAGLTGIWRIGRLEKEPIDDMEADIQYARHQSLLLDLSIVLRTLDLPGRA